jgi:hypothetical protein
MAHGGGSVIEAFQFVDRSSGGPDARRHDENHTEGPICILDVAP